MTDDDFIAHEAKIKGALHKAERALKLLHGALHELRQDVANDRGYDLRVLSGGDGDDKDQPPGDPAP